MHLWVIFDVQLETGIDLEQNEVLQKISRMSASLNRRRKAEDNLNKSNRTRQVLIVDG